MGSARMSLPREVIPERFYMITRRCTQRQFLLRPDAATNNAFIYCLGEAALRFQIDVILPSVLSNHHHTVVYDRHGKIIEFVEHLHKLVAKAQNALRGRWENFWSSEQVCLVRLVDAADVLDKIVYAATNPVKDRLVERVHHWPGVNGLSALLNRRPLEADRPRHFFRAHGPMPAHVTLDLVVPPELGDPDQVRQELRDRVAAVEQRVAADRRRDGLDVVGRRSLLRQSWRGQPTSHEPRRNLRPQLAARSVWSRLEALRRNRKFLAAYRWARASWCAGATVAFPVGTYWLRRFANVSVTASTPS